MENIIINDNLKKESRMYYGFMVISFIVIGMQIIALIVNFIATGKINIVLKIRNKQDIVSILSWVMFLYIGFNSLFFFLYYSKYTVVVTNEKIFFKTLFSNIEIDIKDIEMYKLKTFKRSKMGSFNLTIKNRKKKIVIYTRYSDVLNKFFQEKNIKLQITK